MDVCKLCGIELQYHGENLFICPQCFKWHKGIIIPLHRAELDEYGLIKELEKE
jgi:tRNA(Ile2) C34 agmatinyltransferase TiaS